MRALICLILVFAFSFSTKAQESNLSPAGLWKQIDDVTGKPRSIIKIIENNGVFEGLVEKGFPREGEEPNQKCTKCPGQFKDQPKIGLHFMWDLKKDGNEYSGGQILDPDNGKIYRCKMKLSEDGKSLTVRGFIGISLFGRSQTWIREEN